MGESMVVTLLVLLFFGFFTLVSSKAEKEVDRYYEEKRKAGDKIPLTKGDARFDH